jgi:alkanesulfonate monooxygenase SsuD/methylene tetrahydromethanopterin reductase-like flavin-dependent oxidoreductase (luciferase family)
VPVALVQRAEELGYDSVWSAEAYGSDAITPLAFLAAKTNRIKLGTSIMQLAGRTPANAAMSAASIDATAGGDRFIAGLGVSGPQIVEGWYGQPLKSILHMNPDIPIYLATGGEAMVKLTAEIADGWLTMGFVRGAMEKYGPWLEEGFRRAGNGKSLKDFTIQASVHVEVDNDVKGALTHLKPEVALYVGGMGHRTKNFHSDIMVRRGFGDAARRIQELYLAGHKAEAIATEPDEWVDLKSLVGPPARIRERHRAWEESGADSLRVRSRQPEAIEVMAKARAAELSRDRANGPRARDAGTLSDLFRERATPVALPANILTSGEQASCVHPFASAPSTISATRWNRAWTCRACTPRS